MRVLYLHGILGLVLVSSANGQSCKPGCLGQPQVSCNDMKRANNIECSVLENAGCDCSGCDLCEDFQSANVVEVAEPEVCPTGCLAVDKTCNDHVRVAAVACDVLERAGCDCTGCSMCASTEEEEEEEEVEEVVEPPASGSTAGASSGVGAGGSGEAGVASSQVVPNGDGASDAASSASCPLNCLLPTKTCDDHVRIAGVSCEVLQKAGCDCSGCQLCADETVAEEDSESASGAAGAQSPQAVAPAGGEVADGQSGGAEGEATGAFEEEEAEEEEAEEEEEEEEEGTSNALSNLSRSSDDHSLGACAKASRTAGVEKRLGEFHDADRREKRARLDDAPASTGSDAGQIQGNGRHVVDGERRHPIPNAAKATRPGDQSKARNVLPATHLTEFFNTGYDYWPVFESLRGIHENIAADAAECVRDVHTLLSVVEKMKLLRQKMRGVVAERQADAGADVGTSTNGPAAQTSHDAVGSSTSNAGARTSNAETSTPSTSTDGKSLECSDPSSGSLPLEAMSTTTAQNGIVVDGGLGAAVGEKVQNPGFVAADVQEKRQRAQTSALSSENAAAAPASAVEAEAAQQEDPAGAGRDGRVAGRDGPSATRAEEAEDKK